ncbi:ABC-type branched-subunit amino acid transport system substrate-binding protein [Silvimonas terrae]|uniref:ABC-type branched-subunit amino acid transport system substrate-binding protein n=1 Tax=Silvimonas terrae TaxID=300266 RepID=A0A840RJV1_9NEIS|nr:ABC transporter substrate-binding protein [Silvimonas terrae]MBB5192864.1 ABC-type branched-subunit amino acid transport system substrate-binding protein [Silvimonas terrae]
MKALWLGLLALISLSALAAEPGITENEIVLGQSAALSGPAAELGKGVNRGAKAYFDYVNAHGGVNGRKIKLIALDDGYEPDRAAANTQKLIKEQQVFALFGYVGTPTSNASLPLINQNSVPFIAPFTGADSLRNPLNKNIFNVRAGYRDEAAEIAEGMKKMGMSTINIFYQNDAYGQAGLKAMQEASLKYGIKINATATVQRNSVDVAKAVDELVVKSPANAVFMVTAYKSSAAFITAARSRNYIGPFYNVSFVGTEALVHELKNDGSGVIVSQVMPTPYNPTRPITIDYVKALSAAGINDVDYPSLEGYIGARVLVEGLKRAGKGLTREKLVSALESLGDYDLGGYRVKFSPTNHNGSTYVDLTVVDHDGRIHS